MDELFAHYAQRQDGGEMKNNAIIHAFYSLLGVVGLV